MALVADDAADRGEQLLALTARLTTLVDAEAARLARGAPLAGPVAETEEFRRLGNAYRLEMARIRDDRGLIAGAPEGLRRQLQTATAILQERLDRYNAALTGARKVTEGLVKAIADEVQRERTGASGYGAQGGYAPSAQGSPIALDRRA